MGHMKIQHKVVCQKNSLKQNSDFRGCHFLQGRILDVMCAYVDSTIEAKKAFMWPRQYWQKLIVLPPFVHICTESSSKLPISCYANIRTQFLPSPILYSCSTIAIQLSHSKFENKYKNVRVWTLYSRRLPDMAAKIVGKKQIHNVIEIIN